MTGVMIHRTQSVEDTLFTMHSTVIEKFNTMVAEFRMLLESDKKCIIFCPLSFGKDSSLVVLAAKEAYRQCIAEGTIEATRPFIVSTGDPKAEAMQMKMYSRWAAPKLYAYAAKHNINLYFDFVEPNFNEEYANRYLTSNKLIPNATRSGDCSVILKVIPSERYVKSLLKRFEGEPKLARYAGYNVVCATGQRNVESVRRATNMKSQGTSDKTVEEVFQEVNKSDIKTSYPLYLYAPIRDWSTDEVFCALELAGEKPVTRNLLGIHNAIRGFLPDFGLLLALYGNASKDACEISVGRKVSAGCNGKSRYGCMICTMVSEDKTQIALCEHPRWSALLQEEALRVRDYMFRLSTRTDARMMHAKSVDYAGFGRVALQPNVLKVKYLEKLVRYFAQLSIESKRRADEFKKLVEEGREHEHVGVQDIMNDVTLNAKARRAMLDMYIEQAQKPLIELFSELHAVYLSFRWSLDGVSSLPYRPLAIWNDLLSGIGWIPYPKTNQEYEAIHGKISLVDKENPLPEAVMVPAFKNEDPVNYARNGKSLLDYWSRPYDLADLLGDSNCTTRDLAMKNTRLTLTYSLPSLKLVEGESGISAYFAGFKIELGGLQWGEATIKKLQVNNRTAPEALLETFDKNELKRVIDQRMFALCDDINTQLSNGDFETYEDKDVEKARKLVEKAIEAQRESTFSVNIEFFSPETLATSYLSTERKAYPSIDFTKRVTKKVKGKFERGLTRLAFYPLETNPRIHYAKADNTTLLTPDYSLAVESVKDVYTPAYYIDPTPELGDSINIRVTDEQLKAWEYQGFYDKAMDEHDSALRYAIRNRRSRPKGLSIRQNDACSVAEHLVETGAVTIDKPYMQTFKQLSRRTQLFNELGAFDYQNLSADELLALSHTISMEQHRKDKVQVLLEVRRLRNQKRREILAQKVNPLSNVKERLDCFFKHNNQSVFVLVDSSFRLKHRCIFTTDNPAQKVTTASTWFSMYGGAFGSIETLLKLLLNKEQLAFIENDLSTKREVYQYCTDKLEEMNDAIDSVCAAWAPTNQALKNIYASNREQIEPYIKEIAARKKEFQKDSKYGSWFKFKNSEIYQQSKEVVQLLVSQHDEQLMPLLPDSNFHTGDGIVGTWNPDLEQFAKHVTSMIDATDNVLNQLAELKATSKALIKVGIREVVGGLTIEQRLGAMTAPKTAAVEVAVEKLVLAPNNRPTEVKKPKRKTKANAKKPPIDLLSMMLDSSRAA